MNLDDYMFLGCFCAGLALFIFTDPMALPEAIRELVYLGSMVLQGVGL